VESGGVRAAGAAPTQIGLVRATLD
jgi:hypothetical protein